MSTFWLETFLACDVFRCVKVRPPSPPSHSLRINSKSEARLTSGCDEDVVRRVEGKRSVVRIHGLKEAFQTMECSSASSMPFWPFRP
mmetsp:Transcript_6904/g.21025  ORF Transcript_6904/g.21025 Transcript_6904/m.21025 type:complete len:87 (-) Transcript_6904:1391-1651(-)